jgi:hypothetical protein
MLRVGIGRLAVLPDIAGDALGLERGRVADVVNESINNEKPIA